MRHLAPPISASRQDWIDSLGSLGVSLFALSAWLSPVGYRAGIGLCLLALALSPKAWTVLRHDPLCRFGVLFTGFVALESAHGARLLPDSQTRQWLEFGQWVLMSFGYLAVAWWLRGEPQRIRQVLLMALTGLLLGMLRQANGAEVLAFRTGLQTGFQMYPSLAGLISAAALLGLLLFIERIIAASGRGWRLWVRSGLWLASVYLCAYILVASQARAVWLAMALVFPWVLGLRYGRSWRGASYPRRWLPISLAGLILALLIGGISHNAETLLSRIGPDRETLVKLWHGQTTELPQASSFKYRFYVQRFGLETWWQRPIVGWGTASVKPLMHTSQRPELFNHETNHWLGHVHNTYLEMLVKFGVVGLGLLAYGAWQLVRATWRAGTARLLANDDFLFILGIWAMTGIWAVNDFVLTSESWHAYWLLLAGISYTCTLYPNRTTIK